MSLSDMKQKVMKEASITEDELNSKIKKKMDQLAGLVSAEGACHIIANELGVKLFTQAGGRMLVKNMLPGLRNFEVVLKVDKKWPMREFSKGDRQGKVASVNAGDETGLMRVVFWNEYVDKLNDFNEGDLLKITNGYLKENQGRKEIHLNNSSELEINPEGESIGDLPQVKREFERKKLSELKDDAFNIEVLGTVVQLFEPRFFEVCPHCSKRTRMQESERFVCEEHGEITPDYSYVLNAVIDDGSDNMRIVCFRDQANQLLSKTKEDILHLKDNVAGFEDIKQEILGKIVKMQGRVKKNLMFDRIEFTAQNVDMNPDPAQELK